MTSSNQSNKDKGYSWKWIAIAALALLVLTQVFDTDLKNIFKADSDNNEPASNTQIADSLNTEEAILPPNGVVLPIQWNNLGQQMVETGIIDADKFEALYDKRGGLDEEAKQLLYGTDNGQITMTKENSSYLLNLFWAFGIANKNKILDEGQMQNESYGGAGRFASTGGWSLAKGETMDHYSQYPFVTLTQEQQNLVEEVSSNIYRPCCGNPTSFPDCNHGMAMLGLLELIAAQGATEEQMYQIALQVNAYWFPSTYLTLAKYFQKQGVAWQDVDAKEVLGQEYSSTAGYRKVLTEIEPEKAKGGGSCGV